VSHKTSKPEDSGVIPDNVEISVPAMIKEQPNEIRQNLLQMLSGNKSAPPMVLENILPKFLKVTNRGTAKPVSQLMFASMEDLGQQTCHRLDEISIVLLSQIVPILLENLSAPSV
jgi:hypothetical protein